MKILDSVPDDKVFVLSDGSRLHNLQELLDSLKVMDEEIFSHHVNDQKNDFANWIRDVFLDKRLADQISASKSRLQVMLLIRRRIAKKPVRKKVVKKKDPKMIVFPVKNSDKNLLQVLASDAKKFFSKDTLSIVKDDFKNLFK